MGVVGDVIDVVVIGGEFDFYGLFVDKVGVYGVVFKVKWYFFGYGKQCGL